MLNLVVEMSGEPVVEPSLLDIACPCQLHGDPILPFVRVYVHGEVADLSAPHKPVALQEPDEEIPPQAAPETTQKKGKLQVEEEIES